MSVYIDNQAYHPVVQGTITVQDVVNELKPGLNLDRRLIVSIVCDQVLVPQDRLAEVLSCQIADFGRLDLISISIAELAGTALDAANMLLSGTRPLLADVAGQLQAGEQSAALIGLKHCMEDWWRVHHTMLQILELVGSEAATPYTSRPSAGGWLERLTSELTGLKNCLEQRDHVRLADVLQNGLAPVFDGWEELRQAISDGLRAQSAR